MECSNCGVKIKSDGPADKGAVSGICRGTGGIIGI